MGTGRVEVVVIDMVRPYRAAVREALPQARIIVDRLHLQWMANVASTAP